MEFPLAQMVDLVRVFRLADRRGKREMARRDVRKLRGGTRGKILKEYD